VDRAPGRNRVTVSPRTRRPEQRRSEILDAALELFSERGYHATGVADIAAELNMSHGTFYNYFRSKRDILEQLVDEAAGRISAAVAEGGSPARATSLAEFRGQAQQIADALFATIRADPRLARLLLLEATAVDDDLTERVLTLLDQLRELTATYLRNGVERGFLRHDLDAVETARALNGIVFAGALAAARGGNAPAGYSDAAMRLAFDGVAA
jgi:AcrR family transcriptional regulator